jgi:hypothetical protein
MKKSTWLVIFAFLFGLLIGQPGISNASNTASTGFTFCVNKKSGALRQLLKGSCTTKTENTLVMGAQGPQGVQGAVGPQGEPGVGTPFELLDASGNVITNVVDVEFYPTEYGAPLSFTRIIDKNAYRYEFVSTGSYIPTPVWAVTTGGYFIDENCSVGPYTSMPPSALYPFASELERVYWIPGDWNTWSGNEMGSMEQIWGRYVSTSSTVLPAGTNFYSWVAGRVTDNVWVPPTCEFEYTHPNELTVWELEPYPLPTGIKVEFPVTVRWLP